MKGFFRERASFPKKLKNEKRRMKNMRFLGLGLVLLSWLSQAQQCSPCTKTSYATAGWSGNSFIEVENIPTYPDVVAVPGTRNRGFVSGSGLLLNPQGLTIT